MYSYRRKTVSLVRAAVSASASVGASALCAEVSTGDPHPETRLRLHCPFPALALGGFLPLLDGGTVWAVALVFCLWYEERLADLALFFACRLHNLGKQLPVCGKDCVFEIAAVDSVPADALYASVLLAIVQQKAIAVYIVAAELFNEGIDPL